MLLSALHALARMRARVLEDGHGDMVAGAPMISLTEACDRVMHSTDRSMLVLIASQIACPPARPAPAAASHEPRPLADVRAIAADSPSEELRVIAAYHHLQLCSQRSLVATRKVQLSRRIGDAVAAAAAAWSAPVTVVLVLDTAFTKSAAQEMAALVAASGRARLQMFGTQELIAMALAATSALFETPRIVVRARDESARAALLRRLRAQNASQLKGILITDPLCRLLDAAVDDVLELHVENYNQGFMVDYRVVREAIATKTKQPHNRRVNLFSICVPVMQPEA